MALKQKMAEGQTRTPSPKNDPEYMKKLQERSYRMDMLYEKWKQIPEVGDTLKKLDESKAKTTALRLEQQTRYMNTLTETQVSDGFFGAAPDHMLRLVMFSYPNSIRPELFTEFQMETAKDSIKYIRAFYNEKGSGAGAGTTPQPINRSFNPAFAERPMVESPEDRMPTELAQLEGTVAATEVTFQISDPQGRDDEWKHGYLDGWSSLHTEQGEPLAFQRRSGDWVIIDTDRIDSISGSVVGDGVTVTAKGDTNWTSGDADYAPAYFVGRYDSELDIDGEHLGDAKLRMDSYQFQPRPITMGLSWTHLSELVLGSSFNASVEELLYQAVGEEIRKALDLKAVRIARQEALKSNFFLEWDARPFSVSDGESTSIYNDTYIQHAQLVTHAIARIGDMMYNELLRGGVSRIVGGPAAIAYLQLHEDFSAAGGQVQIGPHKAGDLAGIPTFKVPSSVIPDDELVLFWKNDYNEADVAAAFGVLVPFFSTGTLQRKTFYKEAGVAYYGDHQVLQPKYFGRIRFKNLLQLFPNGSFYNGTNG